VMVGQNFRAFIALVAIVAITASVWSASAGSSASFSLAKDATLVFAGLMIGVLFVAFSFMAGEVTNIPAIKAFAKQELYELAATIIIVVLIAGGLAAYGEFAKNVATSKLLDSQPNVPIMICEDSATVYKMNTINERPQTLLFANVDWFLGCMPLEKDKYVKNLMEAGPDEDVASLYELQWDDKDTGRSSGVMLGHMMNIYVGLFSLEFMLGTLSTFGVSAYLPEPLISSISLDMAPNAGLTPISEAMIMITDLVGMGVGSIVAQKVLLQFVYTSALAVFLPLGVGFRAIPFLRKTGATLIAIALVMYFVYPMSIWINEQIYFSIGADELINWTNYHSLLDICKPGAGESQSEYVERVKGQLIEFEQETKETTGVVLGAWDGSDPNSKYSVDVQLPASQGNALADAFGKNVPIVAKYMINFEGITGPILPTEYFFEAMVDEFTASMSWFVLNLLFLANSIVISITMFKDISLAIGGEPRVFGMSKLI